jgi:ABC-2 type transport system permease protein
MAVFERNYKRWDGPVTPRGTRFLILPRYLFRDVFASKLMVFFYAACFLFPIGCLAFIYLTHNATIRQIFPDLLAEQLFAIDGAFLDRFVAIQSGWAFFLALFIGPGLISRDLANNGLPLYLSRPFSRTQYVVGKMTVLAALLSTITWMAAFLVIAAQVGFEGMAWLNQSINLVMGVFVVSWVWILLLCLLALSVSAWVRWKPVAGFVMMFILLGGKFFATMTNFLFKTEYGSLFDIGHLMEVLRAGMLGTDPPSDISPAAAMIGLAAFVGFFLFLLNRKIRAYEVVS